MLNFMLALLDAGHYDLLKYLMTAEEELGDQFELGYTIGQYFEEIVVWEWQKQHLGVTSDGARVGNEVLVYEDRNGQWLEVPDGAKTYVNFTKTSV